jgi:hypothetical protein
MDRSKLDEKGHKIVKSPTAIAGRDQLLNSAQFRVLVGYFSRPFSSSFELSNLPLDSWYFRLFPFYSKQFCPMLDWTGQNWMNLAQFSSGQLSSAQTSSTQQNSAQFSSIQLNSAQFSSTQLSSRPFSSSFDLSNLPLDSWYFSLFPYYSKQFCPMLDWTMDRSKLDEKGHKIVKSPTAIAE